MSRLKRKTRGGGAIVTVPTCEVKMAGDGLQLRYKLPTGGKISICEMPSCLSNLENGHYHKGLKEVYTVHSGELLLFEKVKKTGAILLFKLTPDDNCNHLVLPRVEHTIIKYPGVFFTVQTVGTPVPNLNRGGNDWFPASDDFNSRVITRYHSERPFK